MNSNCISSCVKDARVPVRANYVNLYKWPESDAEFVKWLSSNVQKDGQQKGNGAASPRVVDSISCRQMYLRSYTFSREESVPEKTQKCFGRVKGKKVRHKKKRKAGVAGGGSERGGSNGAGSGGRKMKCGGMKKLRELSVAAFCSIFHRLLSCSSSVDVMDQ